MKINTVEIEQLVTKNLILKPFTIPFCQNILNNDFSDLEKWNYQKGKSWPDMDVLETLPRIINNLTKVGYPTGFESWMIIKKDTKEIIGDLGFKGFNDKDENVDIGYGIIKEERRKGFAKEAVREIIKWAFSNENIKEITANCLTSNSSSINLLNKLNFTKISVENEMIYWNLVNKDYKKSN
ncbi:GNAT family N-acetyltransferase [Flavobacterium sp. GSP14]|uniref:GNAT family N-acetyltransferase n=1 Tax=Flavobacterium sp. GSP14 TaxID=3401734 RepID=UPI003AAC0F27